VACGNVGGRWRALGPANYEPEGGEGRWGFREALCSRDIIIKVYASAQAISRTRGPAGCASVFSE
jgi:hypothetical protein